MCAHAEEEGPGEATPTAELTRFPHTHTHKDRAGRQALWSVEGQPRPQFQAPRRTASLRLRPSPLPCGASVPYG